jgi:hypothetical protein
LTRIFANSSPTLAPTSASWRLNKQQTSPPITLAGSDPDGDALTYRVTNNQMGSAGGTLAVSGSQATYTPPEAWDGDVAYDDTFTVRVSDAGNGFHIHGLSGLINALTFGLLGRSGDTATSTVTVHVQPPVTVTTTSLPPAGTTRIEDVLLGADGTVVHTSTTGGTGPADPIHTTVDVVHPSGEITTVNATGAPSGGPVIGVDGTAAQSTSTDGATYLAVIHPSGSVTTSAVNGSPIGDVVIGADGTTAQTTRSGAGTDENPYLTTITVIHPSGTTTTMTLASTPYGGAAVSAQGYTAQTTTTGGGDSGDPITTHLTIIDPAGNIAATTEIAETPYGTGAKISPNGIAVQLTSKLLGTPDKPYRTTLTVLSPSGLTNAASVDGSSLATMALGSNGTAALVSSSSHLDTTRGDPTLIYQTAVAVVHPQGVITTTTVDGELSGGPAVGSNGTVAVTTSKAGPNFASQPYYDNTAVVHPDGTVTVTEIYINPFPAGPVVGADGTVVQTSSVAGASAATIIYPSGTIHVFSQNGLPFTGNVAIGADGTVVESAMAGAGSAGDPYRTTVVVWGPSGLVQSVDAPGSPAAPILLTADGTTIQTSVAQSDTGGADNTVVTIIGPSGDVLTKTLEGRAFGGATTIAPNGTTAQVTGDAGVTTLTVINVAGEVIATPDVDGHPISAVLGSDGRLYVLTQLGGQPLFAVSVLNLA